MNDLVSVIMPSYNTADYIADSIGSVLNQTYANWELIIVDDCSNDNTDEIVSQFDDKRIRYLKNDKNSGAAVSRNRALREAKGKWIAFLDSDDLWTNDKLEKQVRFMEENSYLFSYTNYIETDSAGNKTGVKVTGPKHITKCGMYNYCWPGCLTVMYDAEKIGLIQIADIKKNNDYAMWLKVCKKADCYLLDETLAMYRRGRKGSISTHGYAELLKWHYRLYRIADNKKQIGSMILTCRNAVFGLIKKRIFISKKSHVKVSVMGHFGEGDTLLNGQTIKTEIVTEALCDLLGKEQVLKFDTSGGKKQLLKAPFQVVKAMKSSDNVIIFPAHNGLRVYAPLLRAFSAFFKQRKLHYVVIGGWLPPFVSRRRFLKRILKKFDGIYVETNTMKAALKKQGFENIFIMPNCKKLKVLKESELVYPKGAPYKLCTFSRVMKEKGIEDAVNAVVNINEKLGYTAYSLDIYGQVDSEQIEWFENLKSTFPTYIRYCGSVQADRSVDILKDYFALLFPTYYDGEGFAGTLIDAYSAGVPVIASDWKYNTEIVNDNVGYVCKTGDDVALVKLLESIIAEPTMVLDKKSYCLREVEKYKIEKVVSVLFNQVEGY